jgi:hypothetical protein
MNVSCADFLNLAFVVSCFSILAYFAPISNRFADINVLGKKIAGTRPNESKLSTLLCKPIALISLHRRVFTDE